MPTWKRIFLKAAGFGAGTAVAVAVVLGVFLWYSSRPAKPKPWNREAITAEFDRVTTVSDSRLEFQYVLDNKTDKDYELQSYSRPKIAARLESTNSLTGFADENEFVLGLPIFVPARQKARISLTMPSYGFRPVTRLTDSSSTEEQHKYRAEVLAHVTSKMPELNGFVLFDEGTRYQIDLPNGWSKQAGDEKK